MTQPNSYYIARVKADLNKLATVEKAIASQRYFPAGIHCIGANAADIKTIISILQVEHPNLSAQDWLAICEGVLAQAEYSEEVLVAFGLINKFVKKSFDDSLLERFQFWLENYASNWAHVDDLCIKTIYQFFLARPHLIPRTQHWTLSPSPWCRRASCVVWVKFIQRKIGKAVYCLDTALVFNNCDVLLNDDDEFVQKGVGWLLKVTAQHHPQKVINYLESNIANMPRSTIRYAIEKLDPQQRKAILSL
ncbi:DNA alkylation repair protein [Saccharobesus litoralis]|uniref:DNA alkylation repair protein n=1 Tax=Saccharobesus litoralis TaxID=2172099 RepID=A0A2S0VPJ7_9ALTE|nr:DNA alkylation repair protein [Saccharobesus litoralis]AWB66113.1 DNA alkylation repair protein [Saccharobesus litoralis]